MFNFIEKIKNESNINLEYFSNNSKTKIDTIKKSPQQILDPFDTTNFDVFLKNSMFNPIINAPFTESNKKNFAFMENITSFLQKKAQNLNDLCSIIMPCYNREDTIADSILSILNQTYQNFELIIIDDKSTDKTVDIINRNKNNKIKLIINNTHLGCAASRNIGVQSSKGKYIFYLDSDNTWDNRYLQTMLGAFYFLNGCEALYCGQYLFNKNTIKPYAVRFASFNISLLENRNYIDINCFAHTKNIFNSINGFNINLKRLIDYDFILRIAKKTDIYSIPVILSNYFFNKSNNTITNTENYSKSLQILQENLKNNIIYEKNKLTHDVSAIIPNYEAIDDLKLCLDSLNNASCSEIIVIDNNSSIKTQNILKTLYNDGKITKLVLNKTNFGFTYAVNQGLDIANIHNDILLVNNDSYFTTNSIFELQKYAYSLQDCALTVPRQILPAKTRTINIHVPFANINNECDVNLSFHHNNIEHINLFSNGKTIELNFAPFFCVYIKREIYNIIGKLDAEHGRHYRSDRLYCNVIRLLYNKKIYYIPSSKVYHKLQKSTILLKNSNNEQYDIMFKNNKWPRDLMLSLNYKQKLWDL